jgi:hypothetical protein
MDLRLVPANDNPNKAAIAYGPVLLAGRMGKEGLRKPAPYTTEEQNEYYNDSIPASVISTIDTHGKKISDWLKPVSGKPLVFQTTGVSGRDITMIPYYQFNDERYVVYWDLK